MSKYATKQDVKDIVSEAIRTDVQAIVDKAIDKAVSDLSAVMSQFANEVYIKFDEQDRRFDRLEKKDDEIIGLIDGLSGRMDDMTIENAARDHAFARHERWIQELARKTHTTLA